MDDEVGAVKGGGEESLVALNFNSSGITRLAFASMPSAHTMT